MAHTLLLVAHRLDMAENIQLPHMPVEMWMTVCSFVLRSSYSECHAPTLFVLPDLS